MMKNKFILICAILSSLQMMAIPSLVVKPLSGAECITALGVVGKLVYSGDSLYVYDNAYTLVFRDLLMNVTHVRFSDEKPSTPTNIDNTQDGNALQVKVYPNPTQNVLIVENVQGDVLRLYTMGGMLVLAQPVENSMEQVDLSKLPMGNYLLISRNQSFQIIKQ
ncbi:MAG: T9SS type A sorting domain-containing protein [Paludibacteraceae bacterium]|nr:T9SS type A sorting domain-containing protein [Paludibacteraceae bacterium]